MRKGEDDDVVDNRGGGGLWHREQPPPSTSTPAGGGFFFVVSFFFLPLWDASIFQYVYISGQWKSEYFLFTSDKSFIGKKSLLSIIKI